MNHLRELIESLPYNVGFDDIWGSREKPESVLKLVKRIADNAVCFSMGDIDNILTLSAIPDLCKLPFEYCWFEAEFKNSDPNGGSCFAGILCNETDGKFAGSVFLRMNGNGWSFEGTVHSENLSTSDCAFLVHGHSSATQGIDTLLKGLLRFLSAMNCTNVGRQEHKPDAALQKARSKRGKQPLFSYWTLELNGRDGGAAQSFGGTHASPRVHLRRGHPRQYAPGKWTWVQPHAVGNRELGMVHKDYVIGKEMVVH